MRVTAVMVALLLALTASAADKPDELTPERRKELEKKALELLLKGLQQYQSGQFAEAAVPLREAVETCRVLYPKKDHPQGHPVLAAAVFGLGRVYHEAGEYSKAEPLLKEVVDINRALYPKKEHPQGHQELAHGINTLAIFYRDAGEYGKAESLFREALAMWRGLLPKERYPNGHPDLANTIGHLAELYRDAGEYGKAEPLHKEALAMSRALFPKEDYPDGHPGLAADINNLGMLYKDAGEYAKAEPFLKEALAMDRALYPKEQFRRGHPHLAAGISNLALLFMQTGEYGKAEPLFKEALAMSRALYPKKDFPSGHINLAIVINNLAELHREVKEYDKAEPLYKESLAMRRALFPKSQFPQGHPFLAIGIDNLAALYADTEENGKARPLIQEALTMRRALFPREQYPQGHPLLAQSIHNLAVLYQRAGDYSQAEPLYKEALDMCRALFPKKLYPQGHPNLAYSIDELAGLHIVAGEYGKAEPLLRESLDMNRSLALRYADLAAEAEALNYFASHDLTLIRDILLVVSRQDPVTTSAYDAVWDSRAALTRLQQRRHRDLMASRDKDTADLADQLRRTRLDLSGLLLRPGRDLEAHRAKVQKLTDEKEDLEKRIATRLKLAPLAATASPRPQQLRESLPEGAVFVDLYRYTHFEKDPDIKGLKGVKRTPRYVAFVLRKGKDVGRVELKEAAPIERAWAAWHKTIIAKRPDATAEREAATQFAALVWQPIRAVLPANLKTIYLVPDGPLHQVPWRALPGQAPDTVLLDECAVCLVPHGPFLLERLQTKPVEPAGDTLLAYGGVDYFGEPAAVVQHDVRTPLLREKRLYWPDLPGTAREREQIVALAWQVLKADPISRSGRQANTRQLEDDLPKARYAHLATHGFFADPAFRSALQVDPQQFEYRGFGERRSGAARSPLVLSGLVLAGANRQSAEAAPDRGIITAEGLIGLRLEGLELAVLSACETGLGDYGGGEGVYGLQRAFHVAGCKDVVASLWKVDDGATQALMLLFYKNLWEKKLDPAEALRQAQLTLYRHPEAVELAAKRGPIDFSESELPKVVEKPSEKAKRSPTAHWAAFTFSGVRPAEKGEQR